MKILALSDVHGDGPAMQEMAEKAEKEQVDLVLLAGDIAEELTGSVEGVIGPFKAKGIDVGIIPGNHDSMANINFLTEHYDIKNLHGYVLKKGNVGIFGCGYANVGPHFLDDESVFNTLQETHEQLKGIKKKIMLTHTHPQESILGLGMFPGCKGVRKALDLFQPDIHICGHIHETEGIEEVIGKTRVINVGKKGKIIEL
ncbi:hypothetical protein HOC32_05995 [Candidatus Woesearchaeota archaeon]|jgi:uncharacterized protein|nr:hypothetical protein [Candidatus Woesearchaeota archaeon]